MSSGRRRRVRLVVVGSGMVGMRTVETLLSRALNRFDITDLGAKSHRIGGDWSAVPTAARCTPKARLSFHG